MSVSGGSGHEQAELKVELGLPPDADAAELDAATARLRNELLSLDVDRVERPAAGEPPPGARAAELVALGTLIVTLARNAGAIGSVVNALQSWLGRDRNRSFRIELDGDVIDAKGLSPSERERLIAAWIARHAGVES